MYFKLDFFKKGFLGGFSEYLGILQMFRFWVDFFSSMFAFLKDFLWGFFSFEGDV